MSNDPRPTPWAVGWEERPWAAGPDDAGLRSRRARVRAAGPYRAALPARIARLGLDLPSDLATEVEEATAAVVRFDAEISHALPGLTGEIAPIDAVLLRTESASSSQIEHITAGARALALATLGERTRPNAALVAANVRAMGAASRLAADLDEPALLAAHRALMDGQEHARPGAYRDAQGWIGGGAPTPHTAQFVPPHPERLRAGMDDLFAYLRRTDVPALVQAAIAHAQFETIHPFLDGNGRIGRLLVTLYLCVNGVLRKPLLYLSLYLKTHRADYYRLLQEVREHGAWEAWLDFFLTGIADTANQAFEAATRIVDLFKEDRERITTESDRAGSALRIHDLFQQNPFLTANQLVQQTGLSAPTVNAALADLERFGIVEEITGRKRGRVFSYRRYLAILSEGTDPLPTMA